MSGSEDSKPEPSRGPSLEDVLDEYLQALADGREPDQAAYLSTYPDLAESLKGVFKTLDFVEATSKTLNAAQLEKDQVLGDYRIVREVGRGGMGVVYEAVQTSLDRKVALKVLATGALMSKNALERFSREAALAGRLHHTNIVPVYGVGEEQGIPFYAMQFIEGRSLADEVKTLKAKGLPLNNAHYQRIARWGRQVAEALAYAHDQGIIHRDIKPSNLLLDNRDQVWVTDFGLARGDTQSSLTLTGDVVGTARYMSPEQARGGRAHLDERTDVYSLGATLYELLTLIPAYDGESREEVLSRIVFSDPVPLRQLQRSIPRDLETIISKCMQRQPERRYARAGDVAEDLRRFLDGESILARRTPLVIKAARLVRRYRYRFIGSAVVLVLALVIFFLVLKARLNQGQQLLENALSVLLVEKDSRQAGVLLDEAEALGVDLPELYLYRGLIPLFASEPQRALELLGQALERDPDHVEACLAMAYAYHGIADVFNGDRYLKRAAGRDIETALGWLLQGFALSEIPGADVLGAYDRAIALRPDFTPALEVRARYRAAQVLVEGRRSELEPMLADYNAWVTFQPNSFRSYSGRSVGWLHAAAYGKTQPDLAEEAEDWLRRCRADLDKALALVQKDDFRSLSLYGSFLRYLGDFAGSIAAYDRANQAYRLTSKTDHPGIFHHKAFSLQALGDLEGALGAIETSLRLWPDNAFPFPLQRAILLAETGRVEEGREVCRTCMDPQGKNAVWILTTVAGLEFLGDPEGAEEMLQAFSDATHQGGTLQEVGQEQCKPALDYLMGRLNSNDLLAAAGDRPGLRCEFSFLIALRELGQGNRQAGLAALQSCVDTGVYIYIQYRFAQALLTRAQ